MRRFGPAAWFAAAFVATIHAIRHRLPRQVSEPLRILDRRFVEILHLPAAEMAVRADVIPHWSAP